MYPCLNLTILLGAGSHVTTSWIPWIPPATPTASRAQEQRAATTTSRSPVLRSGPWRRGYCHGVTRLSHHDATIPITWILNTCTQSAHPHQPQHISTHLISVFVCPRFGYRLSILRSPVFQWSHSSSPSNDRIELYYHLEVSTEERLALRCVLPAPYSPSIRLFLLYHPPALWVLLTPHTCLCCLTINKLLDFTNLLVQRLYISWQY